jgi:hypothetical protein
MRHSQSDEGFFSFCQGTIRENSSVIGLELFPEFFVPYPNLGKFREISGMIVGLHGQSPLSILFPHGVDSLDCLGTVFPRISPWERG